MASILIHTADESVTLTAQAVKRLLERGDGDAALLCHKEKDPEKSACLPASELQEAA